MSCIKERRLPRTLTYLILNIPYLFKTRQAVFSYIYRNKMWGSNGDDFYSGPGSRLECVTKPYVDKIIEYLKRYGNDKPRIVDLGCGDFMIGRNFIDYCSEYICVDIVPELIEKLKKFGYSPHVKFEYLDIVQDELPEGDICFVRQVLQHLSNKEIAVVLSKLRKYKVIFITEHYPGSGKNIIPNINMKCGAGVRCTANSGVYLDREPFNIPANRLELFLEIPIDCQGKCGSKEVIKTYKLEF